MKHITRKSLGAIAAAALILSTAGIAGAQETKPKQQSERTETQAKKATVQGQVQGTQNRTRAARKQHSGDVKGNQGANLQDGTGDGSPAKVGANNGNGKGAAKKSGKAANRGKGKAGTGGSGQNKATRSRVRNLSESGSASCAGSRAGSRGSGGSRSGGRR